MSEPKPWKRSELAASYGLSGQLAAIVDAADNDEDAVSAMILGEDMDTAEAVVVVLKGNDTVRRFRTWAKASNLMSSRGSGMATAAEAKAEGWRGITLGELEQLGVSLAIQRQGGEVLMRAQAPLPGHSEAGVIFDSKVAIRDLVDEATAKGHPTYGTRLWWAKLGEIVEAVVVRVRRIRGSFH